MGLEIWPECFELQQKKEKKGWIFRKTKVENTDSVTDTIPKAEKEEKDKPAVAEIVKLTATPGFLRRHWAAIIIQTAFRGYLVSKQKACLIHCVF